MLALNPAPKNPDAEGVTGVSASRKNGTEVPGCGPCDYTTTPGLKTVKKAIHGDTQPEVITDF